MSQIVCKSRRPGCIGTENSNLTRITGRSLSFASPLLMYHQQHRYEIDIDEDDVVQQEQHVPPTVEIKSTVIKRKGRGFSSAAVTEQPEMTSGVSHFDRITTSPSVPDYYDPRTRAQRSMEGWTVLLRGLHEELSEDELCEFCADFGRIREVRMALDHRTGYVKGYALVDFESFREARAFIDKCPSLKLLGQPVSASWAFCTEPLRQ